ncbi:MAG: prepilin-type N-terminal cleavage/methylation domain-containing protein [Verrucomicrobiota bacterium]|jgi:type II secretory pathway pseudopilin PulG
MSIRPTQRSRSAWTLVEIMVAVAVFSIVGLVLMGTYLFSVKTMASMYNYALLDQSNRQAMDQLTREIRQARKVLNYTTNSITILTADENNATNTVTYSFSPNAQKMIRTSTDGTSKAILNNCSLLSFQLFKRCPSNSIFGSFPVATNDWMNTVKVLQLTWKTSIILSTGIVNSENIQTARIVIRNQQDPSS